MTFLVIASIQKGKIIFSQYMYFMNWYKISQQNTRSDWIKMLEKAFSLMPHQEVGIFYRWTKPYLGSVSFMNNDQTIRVDLKADIHPFGGAQIVINTSSRGGSFGSTTLEWKGEDFKRMPYDIVKEVYEMIDNPFYGKGFDNDDNEWDGPDDESPNAPSPISGPASEQDVETQREMASTI